MEKPIKEMIIDDIKDCPFSEYNDFGTSYCNHTEGPMHCNLNECPLRTNDYLIKLNPALSGEGEKNEKE